MASNSSDPRRTEKLGWKIVSTGSGVLGAVVTRNLLQKVWVGLSLSDREPPLNPADRRIEWSTALQWALAAGVGASITRLLSQRLAAAGWEAATGSPPPGIST